MSNIRHNDDQPVMFGYSVSRNVSMRSQPGGEELGPTWGEWRAMTPTERDHVLQETVNELIDVWVEQ